MKVDEIEDVRLALRLYKYYYPLPTLKYFLFGVLEFAISAYMVSEVRWAYDKGYVFLFLAFLFMSFYLCRLCVDFFSRAWDSYSFNTKARKFIVYYDACKKIEDHEKS